MYGCENLWFKSRISYELHFSALDQSYLSLMHWVLARLRTVLQAHIGLLISEHMAESQVHLLGNCRSRIREYIAFIFDLSRCTLEYVLCTPQPSSGVTNMRKETHEVL